MTQASESSLGALEPTPQSLNRAWHVLWESQFSKEGFAAAVQHVLMSLAQHVRPSDREVLLLARIAQLEQAIEPGKASAFVAGMFKAAEERGHSPVSSKHALTFLLEELDAAKIRVAELEPQANDPTLSVPRWVVDQIEVLGHQCADGGKCHHGCTSECFRKACCEPLSACTWLNTDWSRKTERP